MDLKKKNSKSNQSWAVEIINVHGYGSELGSSQLRWKPTSLVILNASPLNMFKSSLRAIRSLLWRSNHQAGVKQQPPMHQFRMRPFKPFWDEPKTHPLALPRDFSAPSLPQNFPLLPTPPPSTYLRPPTSLTSYRSINSCWFLTSFAIFAYKFPL